MFVCVYIYYSSASASEDMALRETGMSEPVVYMLTPGYPVGRVQS